MATTELWTVIHAERRALVADLEPLGDEQWSTPSLCALWSVHQVLGHMVATAKMTPPRFFAGMAASGFRFNSFTAAGVGRETTGPPRETLAHFKAQLNATTHPPGPVGAMVGEAGGWGAASYKSIITSYLGDVAKDSGHTQNVFSVANQYFGNNGQIHYNVQLGPVLTATNAMPASGCTLASNDTSGIYADGSGYSSCLDDAQLQAEVDSVSAANHLAHNLSHIFVLYLPKHVESCFNAGETSTSKNQCTINHEPSAAYCAYHSQAPSSTVYANMPYPIYLSKVGFTCGTEKNFGVIESPNGNPDADVEISPTSHEVMEAWTDPDTVSGWYDSSGFENGDECAYIFGPTSGPAGQLYNQTIGGHHYLTQEEFSNSSFFQSGGGCLQGENQA